MDDAERIAEIQIEAHRNGRLVGMREMQGRCRVIAQEVAAEARTARARFGSDLSEQERTAERIAAAIGKLKV